MRPRARRGAGAAATNRPFRPVPCDAAAGRRTFAAYSVLCSPLLLNAGQTVNDLDSFLDVKAAARLLGVSETSLRRWTNSGRLACFRVGGRRERRFRRADLLTFMEGHSGSPTEAGATRARTLLHGGPHGRCQQGKHLCAFYHHEADQAAQAARFLWDGLAPGTVSFLVTTPDARDAVLERLQARRPSVQDDIDARRLVLSEYADSVERQIEYWEVSFDRAIASGAHTLRVVGDVTSAPFAADGDLEVALRYEDHYERALSRRFPVVTLCQYDARPLVGLDVVELLDRHASTWAPPSRLRELA